MKRVRWFDESIESKALLGRFIPGRGRRNRVPDLGQRIARSAYRGPVPNLEDDADGDGWVGENTPFVRRIIRAPQPPPEMAMAGNRAARRRADRVRQQVRAQNNGPTQGAAERRAERIAQLPRSIRALNGQRLQSVDIPSRRRAIKHYWNQIKRLANPPPQKLGEKRFYDFPSVSRETTIRHLEQIYGSLRTRDEAIDALRKAYPGIDVRLRSDKEMVDMLNRLMGSRGFKQVTEADIQEYQYAVTLGLLFAHNDNPETPIAHVDFTGAPFLDTLDSGRIDALMAGENWTPDEVRELLGTNAACQATDHPRDDKRKKKFDIGLVFNPLSLPFEGSDFNDARTKLMGLPPGPPATEVGRWTVSENPDAIPTGEGGFHHYFLLGVHEMGHAHHAKVVVDRLGIDVEERKFRSDVSYETDILPHVTRFHFRQYVEQLLKQFNTNDPTRAPLGDPQQVQLIEDMFENIIALLKDDTDYMIKRFRDDPPPGFTSRHRGRIFDPTPDEAMLIGPFMQSLMPDRLADFTEGDFADVSRYASTSVAETIAELYAARASFVVNGLTPPVEINELIADFLRLKQLVEKMLRSSRRVLGAFFAENQSLNR